MVEVKTQQLVRWFSEYRSQPSYRNRQAPKRCTVAGFLKFLQGIPEEPDDAALDANTTPKVDVATAGLCVSDRWSLRRVEILLL